MKINEEIDNFVSSDMYRPLPFDSELFTEIVCIDGIEHMVYSKEEPDLEQHKRNAAIKKAMFSNFVYHGETIIICARKK